VLDAYPQPDRVSHAGVNQLVLKGPLDAFYLRVKVALIVGLILSSPIWLYLREGLGPEFADFEIEDLNPKRFVQKHLFDDLNADQGAQQPAANGTPLAPGERPPFDPNAT
jgi:Sec-independent protein translocase protein (TatC)